MDKATPEQIRARFDADVERFSNLETGQVSTQDAAYVLELLGECVGREAPDARVLLDLGCGAGNFALRLSQVLRLEKIILVDLSRPMLDRACQRLRGVAQLEPLQLDIRALSLPDASVDIIVAAAVLHHLRGDEEWRDVFARLHRVLRPGGTLWIWDFVEQEWPGVSQVMWARMGAYLESLKGPEYRDHVLQYVAFEDTPRPVTWQMDRLREAGFASVELLHKNGLFAAFAARRD